MTAHQDAAPPRASRSRLPAPLSALFVTVPATAAAVLAAALAGPEDHTRHIVYAGGAAAVLLCIAVAAAAGYRARAARADERAAAAAGAAAVFADRVIPEVLRKIAAGAPVDEALAAAPRLDNQAYRRAVQQVAEEARRSENRRAAAMASCANAAGRMQAITTSMLADLREMEHRHGDADVLGDLLHLDHRTAQAGRVADSIAVLSGARTGRRWAKPIAMESILRGAMGRIAGYQRVRLRAVSDVAVAGHAAEGVMHALAELLDNACNFSPPTTEVHVYVSEVPAGAVVTIEDSGLMMSEAAQRRAERAVSGTATDLSTLTGTRLGLPVVGHLAQKHGLTVSFRPSAIGGTGVVLMIPQELISRARPDEPVRTPGLPMPTEDTGSTPLPLPRQRDVAAGEDADERAGERAGDGGHDPFALAALPRRRRGRTLAGAHPGGVPDGAPSGEAAGTGTGRARTGTDTETGTGDRSAAGDGTAPQRRLEAAGSAARFGAFRRAVTGQERDAEGTGGAATAGGALIAAVNGRKRDTGHADDVPAAGAVRNEDGQQDDARQDDGARAEAPVPAEQPAEREDPAAPGDGTDPATAPPARNAASSSEDDR
ncbi:sensor histidine kinase [Streptomyces sp. WAC 06738]|uniref:ATP-binding protein n=1 Tax=Streptomyces sp. WAC 06738 TaxID=2203210 RepID=UPI000F6D0587|nr:ATP-binding protein [Streptomyces sp. WAC 06738]AZM47922.1 sensor histidine kinase [Streptomyces sp. WAC 06738]